MRASPIRVTEAVGFVLMFSSLLGGQDVGPWYLSISAHEPRVSIVHSQAESGQFDFELICWRDSRRVVASVQTSVAPTEMGLPSKPGRSATGSLQLPNAEETAVEWTLTDDGLFQTQLEADDLLHGMTEGTLKVTLASRNGDEVSNSYSVPQGVGIRKKVAAFLEFCGHED